MSRICFFGAWDPHYPRNRILRAGLGGLGHVVLEARVAQRRAFRRYPALALRYLRDCRRADVILVPEFRHKDMPLARLLAGSRPLAFDPLVSRHDTLVEDWGLHARGSGQARWNRLLDRRALGLADIVLCDTWAHGALYESLGVPRSRLRRVLVGAEDAFFSVSAPGAEGSDGAAAGRPVRLLYLGGFLPLHGTSLMVDAMARLEREEGDLPAFEVRLVGRGIEYEAVRSRAASLGLRRVRFAGATPYAEAPRILGGADIVLGAFGTGAKAGRVIPHKVYQGLAAGRAVVTGDGEGVREVFEPGRDLAVVPRGDADALAAVLRGLIADAGAREDLGRAGRARALEVATPAGIGRSLAAALGLGDA